MPRAASSFSRLSNLERSTVRAAIAVGAIVAAGLVGGASRAARWMVEPPPPPILPPLDHRLLELPPPPDAGRRPWRPPTTGPGWKVIEDQAIDGFLVVTIEMTAVEDGPPVARDIITPLRAHYTEILVYIRRPREDLAVTRVQWSRRHGFVDLDLRDRTPALQERRP